MKTLGIILSLATIFWVCYRKETKTDAQKKSAGATSSVNISESKKNFVPFSWQTKWFKKDLNSNLNLSGKEGC